MQSFESHERESWRSAHRTPSNFKKSDPKCLPTPVGLSGLAYGVSLPSFASVHRRFGRLFGCIGSACAGCQIDRLSGGSIAIPPTEGAGSF